MPYVREHQKRPRNAGLSLLHPAAVTPDTVPPPTPWQRDAACAYAEALCGQATQSAQNVALVSPAAQNRTRGMTWGTNMRVVAWLALCALIGGCGLVAKEELPAPLQGLGFRESTAVTGSLSPAHAPVTARVFVDETHDLTVLAFPTAGGSVDLVYANEVVLSVAEPRLEELEQAVGRQGDARIVMRIPGTGTVLVRAEDDAVRTPADVLAALRLPRGLPVQAEANAVIRFAENQDLLSPRPMREHLQWGLRNSGFFGNAMTVFDADTDGAETLARVLRAKTQPAKHSVVAILDTGIDLSHPSLKPALWVNSDEIAGNGIDDDANGYVDDIHGWDFGNDSPDLADYHGHGTHVAGIVGARGPIAASGTIGAYGIAPFTDLMIGQLTLRHSRLGSMFAASAAVQYAVANGADVINMSFGSPTSSPVFGDAVLTALREHHVQSVASAGNDARDLDQTPQYPCAYEGVMCVAATDYMDQLTSISNYSRRLVHIAAPGEQIHSTWPEGTFRSVDGTSMAAPLVAGTLGLLKSLYPDESDSERRHRVYASAERLPALEEQVSGGRRLNIHQATFGKYALPSEPEQSHNAYCSERIVDRESGQLIARWRNSPYANSGEPGIDGLRRANSFQLCTSRQLLGIRDADMDKYFRLAQNIQWSDEAGNSYGYPIGGAPRRPGEAPVPFNGFLDGVKYTVSGLRIGGTDMGGLIAHVGPRGRVKRLVLRNLQVQSSARAGGVTALNEGQVQHVLVEGSVTGGDGVGGIAGEHRGEAIDSSYFEGKVSGQQRVGGIAGRTSAPPQQGATANFIKVYFRGVLEGNIAGGIVGDAPRRSRVLDSHAFVMSSGGSTVGGIAGRLGCGSVVEASYAEGVLDGREQVGGVVGRLMDAHVRRSFAATTIPTAGAHRGSAVGEVADGTEVIVNGQSRFLCSGNSTRPPPSAITEVFYDNVVAPPGPGGQGRTTAQLRLRATYPSPWFEGLGAFRYTPGFMPVLPGLPRSFDTHPVIYPGLTTAAIADEDSQAE
jgi:hypothetical protein